MKQQVLRPVGSVHRLVFFHTVLLNLLPEIVSLA